MSSYLTELTRRSETEFLEFRQRLKESIRRNTQNGNDIAPTSESESEQRKRKLPYKFGSFFGPSQPSIGSRVLQESKPLLKDELLAAKMLDSIQTKKSCGPTSGSTANELKRKAEKLKESRDYSFLFSDDAELPVSVKEPPSSLKAHVPNTRPSSRGSQMDRSRPASSGSELRSRQGSSTNGQAKTKDVSQTHKPSSKLGTKRPSSSKPLTSGPKQEKVEQRKVSNELKRPSRMVPRQQALPPSKKRGISKPPLKQPHQLQKMKKKKEMSEDEQARRMLREMCKTDRFAGRDLDDYDDRDMEASFEDIIKEEKRSEKLAKKEDAEQLRLIEEEERREIFMRNEKKQKLRH